MQAKAVLAVPARFEIRIFVRNGFPFIIVVVADDEHHRIRALRQLLRLLQIIAVIEDHFGSRQQLLNSFQCSYNIGREHAA
ncbi:hypothetical protein D3C71_1613880 [compost metagenome]